MLFPMHTSGRWLHLGLTLGAVVTVLAACQSAALQANQTQVQQQQEQIEQMQKEIAELKSQQTYRTPEPLPSSCDRDVLARATRQAGDNYTSGDFSKALGYYQDALTACPRNPRAELNVGRAYEALNNREQALVHYQQAASSGDPTERAAEAEAHLAVDRLSGVAP
jgi:tetratricopeptide (TPR) repeat protein